MSALLAWCVPSHALKWGWTREQVDAAFACQLWVAEQRAHNRTWNLT